MAILFREESKRQVQNNEVLKVCFVHQPILCSRSYLAYGRHGLHRRSKNIEEVITMKRIKPYILAAMILIVCTLAASGSRAVLIWNLLQSLWE